jgi:hypothetical protein
LSSHAKVGSGQALGLLEVSSLSPHNGDNLPTIPRIDDS